MLDRVANLTHRADMLRPAGWHGESASAAPAWCVAVGRSAFTAESLDLLEFITAKRLGRSGGEAGHHVFQSRGGPEMDVYHGSSASSCRGEEFGGTTPISSHAVR